jgi:hypothetical protein
MGLCDDRRGERTLVIRGTKQILGVIWNGAGGLLHVHDKVAVSGRSGSGDIRWSLGGANGCLLNIHDEAVAWRSRSWNEGWGINGNGIWMSSGRGIATSCSSTGAAAGEGSRWNRGS